MYNEDLPLKAASTTNVNNIYNMAGNVNEWTTETSIRQTDQWGGTEIVYVARGGSTKVNYTGFPTAQRYAYNNGYLNYPQYDGFRVVLYK